MHELGIAKGVVRTVLSHLPVDLKVSVKRVKVSVGELSAVVPEFLMTWYEVASRGTGAEGSRLVIEKEGVKIGCLDCKTVFSPGRYVPACPECFGRVAVLSGRDVRVVEIDTEEEEEIPGMTDGDDVLEEREVPL
jgi:hydrogenase nickel incorporation protein HypA/HybF